ncbi:hypothetical protein H5410_047732 [Solanum commersonii]|uniref:Uncharacterized protein n=1 Tax=Solanum commersonii TaxID=4109 RepID=A0A9J5XHZ1_SOLCO|nr:hypothetical protein H5410_047732 [Solanum commersonii]
MTIKRRMATNVVMQLACGVATAAPPLLLRFRKSLPLETYVTFANRDAAAQQYDYAALFCKPLFLVVDWW